MNLSAPFIRRPVATVLLTLAVALGGLASLPLLPIASLPQVDFPTISVSGSLPGASPQTMATTVATPLERRLGRIAGVDEMTSSSSNGQTRITLQFDLGRAIDGAARDVMAAINAARADLPASLKSNPSYREVNPAEAPVMVLALTSPTRTPGQIYDAVSTVVAQQLLQVDGVGDVELGGASLPAIRVELNTAALARYGVGPEDVRAALASANANRPKGVLQGQAGRFQIYTADTGERAADFRDLVVAWRDGAPVRLSDVASVVDGVEDVHTLGLFNGKPAVVASISRQPGANVVQVVDSIRRLLPTLQSALPADVHVTIAADRSTTIRASLLEVGLTLVISLGLVLLVGWLFLRSGRAALAPAVVVTVSLLGAVGFMRLAGFSLNNLSLMALTVATGFVVDDAVVVLENISRRLEDGMPRLEAALAGAREVGFTVTAISISLIAVFIPLLFMGGLVGRLFREFALTLSAAVMISLALSLTTTPMICAYLLPAGGQARADGHSWFARLRDRYGRSVDWCLDHGKVVLLALAALCALNVGLLAVTPKGFFPEQDTGQLTAGVRADQSISPDALQAKLKQLAGIVRRDPAVENVVAFTGGTRAGSAFMFVTLKPPRVRRASSEQVIARLRPRLARVAGVRLFLNPVQDVRVGGRQSNSTYQFTLESSDQDLLRTWAPRLANAMRAQPALTDVDDDQQDHALKTFVTVDKDTASRLGVALSDVDNALYDSFGQRQVSTIYRAQNQYHVVMEADPRDTQEPSALSDVYVPETPPAAAANPVQSPAAPPARDASTGAALAAASRPMVPLAALGRFAPAAAPSTVNHQDGEPSATLSFNLAPGASLSDAQQAIRAAEAQIGLPASLHGSFQGSARVFQQSLHDEPLLILAAIVAIYLVLGILYESYVHPLTVLSTLPAVGVGALAALWLCRMQFTIIALIGVILLIGLVKKNAIMLIDFALQAERRGATPRAAIREACMLRFRPIMMTSIAAGLGALPLAIGFGEGSELRRPLGVAIIGGLLVSQFVTLLTTPVVYLALDRLRRQRKQEAAGGSPAAAGLA